MITRIQLRRDTGSNWAVNNPILAIGEIGIDTSTFNFKIGNGVDSWNNLNYFSVEVADVISQAQLDAAIAAINLDLSAVSQSIIPDDDEVYDLGSSSNKWKDLYLSGDTIFLGDIQLKENQDGTFGVFSDQGGVLEIVLSEGQVTDAELSSDSADIKTRFSDYVTATDTTLGLKANLVNGRVPVEELPLESVNFRGTFGSAQSTTEGDLPETGELGDLYIADQDYTSTEAGNILFRSGDKALWDGTNWRKNEGIAEIATQEEAETGAINNKLMTPLRTFDLVDFRLGNVTNESKTTMFTDAALTGVPIAPTAAASTNTNQIATTEFVQQEIGTGVTATNIGLENVTNESKETMFTDAALTGVPSAPTADEGTDTTQIATTAFVQQEIAVIDGGEFN